MCYVLNLVSDGGVDGGSIGPFREEDAARDYAAFFGWKYTDENGFSWNIEIEEDDDSNWCYFLDDAPEDDWCGADEIAYEEYIDEYERYEARDCGY